MMKIQNDSQILLQRRERECLLWNFWWRSKKKHIWIMIKIIVNQNSSFWCCIFLFCDGNKMTMSNFKKVQKITNDWSHMVHRYSNKIKLPAEQIYLDISNSKMVDQKW